MSKREILHRIVTATFLLFMLYIYTHFSHYNKFLAKYISPYESPISIFLFMDIFLGIAIFIKRDKIREMDNLNTMDMIIVALLLIGFALFIIMTIILFIKTYF